MNELDLVREDIPGTCEEDIDFWALKLLTYLDVNEVHKDGGINHKILLDQNNIYLTVEDPKDLEEYKSHLSKNGVAITDEKVIICG